MFNVLSTNATKLNANNVAGDGVNQSIESSCQNYIYQDNWDCAAFSNLCKQTSNYYFTEAPKTALFEIIYFCITGQGKGTYGVCECASETDGDLIQLTNTNYITGALRELTRHQHDEHATGEVGYLGPNPHLGGEQRVPVNICQEMQLKSVLIQGLFAAANIFSSLKLVYIFSVNPYLGPLQVSATLSIGFLNRNPQFIH